MNNTSYEVPHYVFSSLSLLGPTEDNINMFQTPVSCV
jgi:hypothetical protein